MINFDFDKEEKRQELIKLLASAGYGGLSDGRTLQELTLRELQDIKVNQSGDESE